MEWEYCAECGEDICAEEWVWCECGHRTKCPHCGACSECEEDYGD